MLGEFLEMSFCFYVVGYGGKDGCMMGFFFGRGFGVMGLSVKFDAARVCYGSIV